MTPYNTSNIISALNVSVIKYVIGIFKDHSQKVHRQKQNKRNNRKHFQTVHENSLSVCLVQLSKFTGGYIWDLWTFISIVHILYVSKTC